MANTVKIRQGLSGFPVIHRKSHCMLKSYFKTALRFLLRNKTFSAINIFGLTAGTLCCLYIVLFVTGEYSYDHHHDRVQDIYRIDSHTKSIAMGREADGATVVAPIAPLMKKDYPEVEQFVRVVPFLGIDNHYLHYGNKVMPEKDAVYVDSTFFQVFKYHFDKGQPSTALNEPYSVVLLKPTADKLFGNEDPIGKTITIENTNIKTNFVVRAVVDESLGKSSIHANIFLTMNSGDMGDYALHTNAWSRNSFIASFVRLRPNADPAQLTAKLPALVNKYGAAELKQWGVQERLFLQPMTTIHTTPNFWGYQRIKPVNPTFLTILLSIALLIQVIACINFMNLSTARASQRAKEVGIRKVIGARRKALIGQFLGESFLLSLLGVLIAIPLLIVCLPWLNTLTGADIPATALLDRHVWFLLAGLVSITGLLAGSYPAFYLSAFEAIKVIKGNFTSQISAIGIRRSLVVFQFVLAITLITGIIVIYRQLDYMKNMDLGFERSQRLIFTFETEAATNNIPAFYTDLQKVSGINTVTDASSYLSNTSFFSNGFWLKGQKESDNKGSDYIITDENFLKTNGITLVAGRDFRASDSAKILINESFARQLGLTPEKAVGAYLDDSQDRLSEIVGVMKDFNYNDLHKAVDNFVLWKRTPHKETWPFVIASASTTDYKNLLSRIAALWKKDINGVPFTFHFLDEEVQKNYEADIAMSHIINAFTGMAILISCLGLFGLAAFSAEQRSKEIGIRKVLGASIPGIAQLLSKDFLKLVLIAFLIATPIAWWAMNKWLEAFAYKVTLSWWMFALAGFLSLGIAILTVSFQAIRAAVANPVKTLRSE